MVFSALANLFTLNLDLIFLIKSKLIYCALHALLILKQAKEGLMNSET